MKIYKKKDKILIEIPFWSKRINPYMIDKNGKPEDVGEYSTLIGMITYDGCGNEEMGLAYVIDMDYKDKGDQIGGWVIKWFGNEEELRKVCKEIGLGFADERDISMVRKDCREFVEEKKK